MSTLRPNKCFQAAANFMSLLFLRRAPAISRTGPTPILFPPFCFDKKNTEGHFFLHLFSKSSSEEKKKNLLKLFLKPSMPKGTKLKPNLFFIPTFLCFLFPETDEIFFLVVVKQKPDRWLHPGDRQDAGGRSHGGSAKTNPLIGFRRNLRPLMSFDDL